MLQEVQKTKRHSLSVMDRSGDTKSTWDPNSPTEVAEARRTFNEWRDKGYTLFRVGEGGRKGELMREFDPAVNAMIMVPRIAGG